ncbi:uncharacterized protein DFL_005147 [Arthrobotrys flagrans]|uniref:Uncharacterized protein n=1 Tax=Arthrobotrys flagrans TaxID=97331 RepID=A0A437A707_ARTFL|nr:hypothetical protein DFL_005147 [Arthrobotrys flagrans]
MVITNIKRRIAEKKAEIGCNRVMLWEDKEHILRVKDQRAELKRSQVDYEGKAIMARERAGLAMLTGILVAILTLGLGFVYAMRAFKNSEEESQRAERYTTRATDCVNKANTLKSSYTILQSSTSSLGETDLRFTNEKTDLVQNLTEKEKLRSKLSSNVVHLERKVSVATSLSNDTARVEATYQTLSTNTEELRRNLQNSTRKCQDGTFVYHDKTAKYDIEGAGGSTYFFFPKPPINMKIQPHNAELSNYTQHNYFALKCCQFSKVTWV